MEKQEFIEKLRISLNGKVSPEVLTETADYYEEYISTQVRLGKSEEEVMETLGDPRLIAKTIAETNGGAREERTLQDDDSYSGKGELRGFLEKLPGWLWIGVIFIIVLFVLTIVFRVLIFLAPVLIVGAIVVLIFRLFQK